MRVMIQYRSGQVPDIKVDEEVSALWSWVDRLAERPEQRSTVVLDGGTTIAQGGLTDYDGEVFGMSILEVESAESARLIVADWPELAYGGHVDILKELAR